MPDFPRIAAVFATMNRRETAVTCVRRLVEQTHPLEWIVVADNVSTDETAEAIEDAAQGDRRVVVMRMKENVGNAGGVAEAMEWAFGQGADAVWVLDDDSWPRADALEKMLEHDWNPRVVLHPLQIDPQNGRFTWPLQVADGHGSWRLADTIDELPAGTRVRTRIVWTGALISREVRAAVGPVNGGLFIRGEDEEYPWRIECAGFTQEAVCAAMLDHPGPTDIRCWRVCGKKFFFEPRLADWKLYYKTRNMVWLKRQQGGWFAATAIALAYALSAMWHSSGRRATAVTLSHAIRDGFAGRLGRAPAKIHPV